MTNLPARRLLTLAALTSLYACGDSGDAAGADPNVRVLARGDLPITVKENAELQALRETIVRSEVEGQSTIIFIIAEGTHVKQGEKLVELDVSELVEKRATQAIAVAKADAALVQAKKELEILQKELTTKRNTAASTLRIAEMELEKFLGRKGMGKGGAGKNSDMVKKLRELVSAAPSQPTAAEASLAAEAAGGKGAASSVTFVDPRTYAGLVDKVLELLQDVPTEAVPASSETNALERDMGDLANQVLKQTDEIRIAMSELKVKEDTFGYSKQLAQKQFITRTELEKDQLAFQSQLSRVTLAWNNLDLLINYTLVKERIKMTQDVENAGLEFDRVLGSNEAAAIKADSDLKSRQAEYDLAKERLDNLDRQIKSAVVFAPTPGLVVYARLDRDRRGGEAVREGVQVRERQELIVLPDTSKMRCIIKVQEAQVDKIERGQIAYVQTEALPGVVFTGRVTSVAPVADSNSGWMTSDRKVYTTVVELDGDNADTRLRSRMAAAVTIMAETVEDTLPVPLQAVRRDRSVNYVWKQGPAGPVATRVVVGRQNTESVEIVEGMAEGDSYYIVPPLGAEEPKFDQPAAPTPAPQKPTASANDPSGETQPADDGPRGERGPGNGRNGGERGNRGGRGPGMGGPQKKLAEMTPEELAQYRERMDRMTSMVDRIREGGNEEQAKKLEETIASLKKALDQNLLEEAQTHADAIRAMMRTNMGAMGGGRRDGGGGGGNGGGAGSGEPGGERGGPPRSGGTERQ